MVASKSRVKVVKADITAGKSVVHQVDGILLPQAFTLRPNYQRGL